MKKVRVEVRVMAEQESLARYHMNWDSILREEFESKGDGVWHSVGDYRVGYDEDSANQLKEFVDDRMQEYGVTEFYSDVVEYDD